METAARLRPELLAHSIAATGHYATGRAVFARLAAQVNAAASVKPAWELRIVEDNGLNAFASPDGTVYVESGLASLAGPSAGLWAAILSHEIAHVTRRDWARRYLFQKHLESGSSATIVLGTAEQSSTSWIDADTASADLGRFCRQMEIDADRDGLMLMARAGYHPDFVPALHHLLHASSSGVQSTSMYSMHPCWEERDRELSGSYSQASIEFEHRWPDWYASPGGNPPVVVFAEPPQVKKIGSKDWQIQMPMRCQNLAGAVEVVLRAEPERMQTLGTGQFPEIEDRNHEIRQLTGCTSPQTTVVFTLSDLMARQKPGTAWTDVYVVDARGSVLTRKHLPKFPHSN